MPGPVEKHLWCMCRQPAVLVHLLPDRSAAPTHPTPGRRNKDPKSSMVKATGALHSNQESETQSVITQDTRLLGVSKVQLGVLLLRRDFRGAGAFLSKLEKGHFLREEIFHSNSTAIGEEKLNLPTQGTVKLM